jgi:FAD/FMN-containing dehydrogenase
MDTDHSVWNRREGAETMDTMTEVEALAGLRERVRGDVLAPGEEAYDGARALWNGMVDRKPAVIVRVEGTRDVSATVRFAREHGLVVTARGGGHGVAGNALSDGGLVVDLTRLKDVSVDPDARTARAGGGVTLGELDAETQAHVLATPLGVVTKTGIAGLTLSGGIGWLRRKHGLAADNLVSLEVVTADGQVLTASENENDELFWALRGGGGSFGVVTALEYRLHPVGPDVAVAFVLYPGERAVEILRAVDEYAAAAPEDVSPLAFLGHVPHSDAFPAEIHGRPYVAVAAVHPGAPEVGERVLRPLRVLGEPLVDLSGSMPYVEAQGLLDEDYPDGWRYYWKSVDLDELADEALERIAAHAWAAPSHHSTIDVWYHGGAMGRVDPEATAFGRRPAYLIGVEANWEPGHPDAENVAWAREAVDDLGRFSRGGSYLNFPGFFEEGDELLRASYGERNYERLVALKTQLDPEDVIGGLGGIKARAPLA